MNAVLRIIAAVRRRQRLADSAWGLARIALPAGLFIAAAALVATRRFGAPPMVLWLTALPVPLVLGWAMLRRHGWRGLARRIDAHYQTGDELGNALELSRAAEREGSGPRSAQIVALLAERAEARAAGLDPAPVVPLSVPPPRWLDLAGLAAVGAAMLIPPPAPPVVFVDDDPIVIEATPPPPRDKGPDLAHAQPLRDALSALAGTKDDRDTPAKIAAEMLDVLQRLEDGEIDRAQAMEELERLEEMLAEAEERFEASLEEDPGLLGEAMRDLADALEEHELTEEAAKAMDEGKGDDAEQALNDAAEQALSEEAERKLAEQMEKAMADAEKALAKSGADSRGTERELAEAERRLKREQKKEPKTPEAKKEQERRLKRMKDKVEELKRRQQREQAARDKVEKLRRQAKNAANRKQGRAKQRDAVQRLSRGANQASKTARSARRLGQARDSMQEAKSAVRRAGSKGEGQQRRRQQMRRFSNAAKGNKGKDGKGKDGKGKGKGKGKSTLIIEGEVGEGEPNMIMETPGDGQGQGEGQGEGQGQDGDGQGQGQDGQGQGQGQQPGDGIGEGSVEPLSDPTAMNTNKTNVRVKAQQGRGATRAEVIRDASQQGFAGTTYKNVYEDYRSFAQSAIDNEALPAAQRRRVKRYYQLIQPRK